jgi:hypothetical protein
MKPCVLVLLGILFGACAPRAATPDPFSVPFTEAAPEIALQLLQPFGNTLRDLSITLVLEGAKTYRYDGSNDTAFLAAIDRFYLENPSYCPLEKAFYYAENKTTLMTIAAKPNTTLIKAFIYDLASRPKFVFAYVSGSSKTPQKTAPCRSAATP